MGVSWLLACNQRAPAGFNDWRYCSAHLDADLQRAASGGIGIRLYARGHALASVQRDLLADAAFLPLFRIDDIWASATWLHGLNPSPYDAFWNVYDWSIGDP